MKSFGEKIKEINYKKRDGVYALISDENGNIATVKTPRGYFLPGGGIEAAETHKQALVREVKEEIGYSSEIGRYIGTYSMFVLGASKPIYYELIGNFYECHIHDYLGCEVEGDHKLIWLQAKDAIKCMQLEYQAYAIKTYLSS